MDMDLRAFVCVVERGGFTEAAPELGITPSAGSKLIARLEDRLGVMLLNRTTRRQSLTPEGETFYARVRTIVAELEDAEAEVAQGARVPRGRLRVNTMAGFAFHILPKLLPEFMRRFPQIEVELAVTDRVVDLVAANADVGIRSGTIEDPTLHTRKIVEFERRLYAAPDYVARHGMPASPRDLMQHQCIVQGTKRPSGWFFQDNGQVSEYPVNAHLFVDSAEGVRQMAMAGAGLALIADILVGDAVKRGLLVPVLGAFHVPSPIPLSAVYPHGRHRLPKVRVFIDFLDEIFQGKRVAQVPPRHAARG